jgi:hypothetical protein
MNAAPSTLDGLAADLGHDPRTFGEIMGRVTGDDWDAWERQVARLGGCTNPIILAGRTLTADGRVVFESPHVMVPCKNRRESVCPSCSYRYRGDAWQLLYAGLVGGRKDVDASVATHPKAFVTVTGPSFGYVHAIQKDGHRCRPRRDNPRCPHGVPLSCTRRHTPDDVQVGQPMCPRCYNYRDQALFNWWASEELWRRFKQDVARCLAQRLGYRITEFNRLVRIEHGKVAEMQRRGVVHFHAVMRVDANADGYQPPPIDIPYADLEAATKTAARRVRYTATDGPGTGVTLRFGKECDVQEIAAADLDDGEITSEAVAAYITKYQTKGGEDFGLGGRPVTPAGARHLGCSAHVQRIIQACHDLAADVPELRRMVRWTHLLGFRGHVFSKSRRFSTTFGALRKARADYRRRADRQARGLPDDQDDETTLLIGEWSFAGVGYETNGDAMLAASIAARSREHRDDARDLAVIA